MSHSYCDLTDAELTVVRERYRHFVPIRIDDCTIIYIDPSRDVEEAKKKFIRALIYWRTKHINDD